MSTPENLQHYASNVTSQFGEDGILTEILRRLGPGTRRCVEFGAWDGKHFSNTWSLWHEQGWAALLIEGHTERCAALAKSLEDFPKVKAIQAYVAIEGPNSLDGLLEKMGWLDAVDVLSIDIDGDDYHVFASLKKCTPRIILVEFNPTCPPEAEIVQAPGGNLGCSALSLLRLGHEKGYQLAACTDTNLILIRQDEFSKLGLSEVRLQDVQPKQHLAYVMTDYAGNAYLNRLPVYQDKIVPAGWSSLFKGKVKATRVGIGQALPIDITARP